MTSPVYDFTFWQMARDLEREADRPSERRLPMRRALPIIAALSALCWAVVIAAVLAVRAIVG
jgi:hypothetical protein